MHRSFHSRTALGSQHEVDLIISPFAPPASETIGQKRHPNSSLVSWFDTASCMDLNQRTQNDQRRGQYIAGRRSWSNEQDSQDNVSPMTSTRSVHQTHWEHVPVSYRPRDWRSPADPRTPVSPLTPAPLFDRNPDATSRLSRRQRPSALPPAYGQHHYGAIESHNDPSLLHPQTSSFEDDRSTHSAPDQMQHIPRSVSQPNTPRALPFMHPQEAYEAPLVMIPRSPTYPPAGRRRPRSATNIGESTFTDAEEFHLFVQATSGLGPEQPFRNHTTNSGHQRYDSNTENTEGDTLTSPLQQTPTTLLALQQLAQMPEGSHTPPTRPEPRRLVTEQRGACNSGVDLWLQPPSATWDNDEASGGDDDEELPDYAASQAQAQAQQRVEAARRAQELARRWQQSR